MARGTGGSGPDRRGVYRGDTGRRSRPHLSLGERRTDFSPSCCAVTRPPFSAALSFLGEGSGQELVGIACTGPHGPAGGVRGHSRQPAAILRSPCVLVQSAIAAHFSRDSLFHQDMMPDLHGWDVGPWGLLFEKPASGRSHERGARSKIARGRTRRGCRNALRGIRFSAVFRAGTGLAYWTNRPAEPAPQFANCH
jgi:hypothetical protein